MCCPYFYALCLLLRVQLSFVSSCTKRVGVLAVVGGMNVAKSLNETRSSPFRRIYVNSTKRNGQLIIFCQISISLFLIFSPHSSPSLISPNTTVQACLISALVESRLPCPPNLMPRLPSPPLHPRFKISKPRSKVTMLPLPKCSLG